MATAVHAIARRPILGDMALRYKRSGMIIALIIAAIHWTPYVNFDNLNVFGVQVGAGVSSRRFLVLSVLWLTFLYTAAWCAYYCWLDWRRWKSDLTTGWGHDGFPELAMFWGATPSDVYLDLGTYRGWERVVGGSNVDYLRRRPNGELSQGFSLPKSTIAEVRENYRILQLQIVTAGLCAGTAGAGLLWEGVRLL